MNISMRQLRLRRLDSKLEMRGSTGHIKRRNIGYMNMQKVGVAEEGVKGRVRWTENLLWNLLKGAIEKK